MVEPSCCLIAVICAATCRGLLIHRQHGKVLCMILQSEPLIPLEKQTSNISTYLWKAISSVLFKIFWCFGIVVDEYITVNIDISINPWLVVMLRCYHSLFKRVLLLYQTLYRGIGCFVHQYCIHIKKTIPDSNTLFITKVFVWMLSISIFP